MLKICPNSFFDFELVIAFCICARVKLLIKLQIVETAGEQISDIEKIMDKFAAFNNYVRF